MPRTSFRACCSPKDGGIAISIAAKKPNGVVEENWLPINRKGEDIGAIIHFYVSDFEKMKTWHTTLKKTDAFLKKYLVK